jgi:hypothetical protein
MHALSVWAPAPLLLHPELPPAAKLVWLVQQLDPDLGPEALAQRVGITRATVHAALLRLAMAGRAPQPGGPDAWLPAKLLLTRWLKPRTRLLYAQLHLLLYGAGQFTYPALSRVTGESSDLLRRGVQELEAAGWLRIHQENRNGPVHFELIDPCVNEQEAELSQMQRRLEQSPFLGESLMWEYLDLLIDSQAYLFHASMGFLIHPQTQEQMQYSRYYYTAKVAFDLDGPNFQQRLERLSAKEIAKQSARDLIKLGISVEQKITLLKVRREDLSLAGMQQKIGRFFPQQDLTGQEDVIEFLESVSRQYRVLEALVVGPTRATGVAQVVNQ